MGYGHGVRVHGPRVTAVQMRNSSSNIEPNLAALGSETTAEVGVSDRRTFRPARILMVDLLHGRGSSKELRDEFVQILLPVDPGVTAVRFLKNRVQPVPLE